MQSRKPPPHKAINQPRSGTRYRFTVRSGLEDFFAHPSTQGASVLVSDRPGQGPPQAACAVKWALDEHLIAVEAKGGLHLFKGRRQAVPMERCLLLPSASGLGRAHRREPTGQQRGLMPWD